MVRTRTVWFANWICAVSILSAGSNLHSSALAQTVIGEPPVNDDCPMPIDVGPLPAAITGDTTSATTDVPFPCGFLVDGPFRNVWYSVLGTGGTLTASTCSTDTEITDTEIAVYCADCEFSVCVDGNDDDCGGPNTLLSTISWCSQPGQVYFITVGGGASNTPTGVFELSVSDAGDVCDFPVECELITGACCVLGDCEQTTTEDLCDGEFFPGETCPDFECPSGCQCDDGLFCNGMEVCDEFNLCQPGTPVDCSHLNDDCNVGVCDEDSDSCVAMPLPDGTMCDDGQFCTAGEVCIDGFCAAPDTCKNVGDSSEFFDRANHYRGNAYRVTSAVSLTEIRMLLGLNSPTPIYVSIHRRVSDTPGTWSRYPADAGWVISSPVVTGVSNPVYQTTGELNPAVYLEPGFDYAIAFAWETSARYFKDLFATYPASTPAEFDFGQVLGLVGLNPVTPPMADSISISISQNGAYAMTLCVSDAADCTHLDDQCNVGVCDEDSDTCVAMPLPDGTTCDDEQFCTAGDSCEGGTCVGAPHCDDQNACTVDTCDEMLDECVYTPDDDFCDNLAFCDGVETCDPLLGCVPGTPVDCSHMNGVCLVGICDETLDACVGQSVDDGQPCDDGLFCTDGETCGAGMCQGGTPLNCADAVDCTIDTCDEIADACVHTPDSGACNDSSPCTTDVCEPLIGCTFTDNGTCGACCDAAPGLGGTCVEGVVAGDCTGPHQTFYLGGQCSQIQCGEIGGACCDGTSGECSVTLQADCNCALCVWSLGVDCSQIECQPPTTPIPTTSQWGLLVLAILLLTGLKLRFGANDGVSASA